MILGLLLLFFYLYLLFIKVEPLTATLFSVILGFIINLKTPLDIGHYIANSLGSFIALIGFIIMLGRGLGEILHETGISQTIIYLITNKLKIEKKNNIKISIIITTIIIVGLLGTLAGGLAILAPSIRSLAARVKICKPSLAILLQAAAEEALIIGPLAPPVLTILAITKISYVDLLLHVSLPITAITILVTWFVSNKYEIIYATDQITEEFEKFIPTNKQKKISLFFIIFFTILVGISIYLQGRSDFVIVILLTLCIFAGVINKFSLTHTLNLMQKGMSKNIHLYLLFILLDPLMRLIDDTGIFKALPSIISKNNLLNNGSILLITTGFTGAIGMPGAAESTIIMLNKIFGNLIDKFEISQLKFTYPIIFATRMTNYLYPGANMFASMGAANSDNLLAMVKNGWTIVAVQSVCFILLMLL